MKTILASVYSINPYKGSEEGMGWNYVYQAARFQKVIAVTRENNRAAIEQYMLENPSEVYSNMSFLYYDLPRWSRFWKKGSRGVILYYLLWQYFLPRFIRKTQVEFDITHNMNFHNDWSPSYLWKLGKPFVWGPIGHHPIIPMEYIKQYKLSYLISDRFTWLVKQFFWKVFPPLKQTVKHADYIWSMNSSVKSVLPITHTAGHVSASVATQDFGWIENCEQDKFTLISAGRLIPLKGFDLTIRSFAKFLKKLSEAERNKCELLIVGSGPEKTFYADLVEQLDIENNVQFISWIDREKLMNMMKTASAFVFPSHEGAGMVVPEALSFGLPVICLNNAGPGELIDDSCGFRINTNSYHDTVMEIANAMFTLHDLPSLKKQMRINARERFQNQFNWNRRGEQLNSIYNRF